MDEVEVFKTKLAEAIELRRTNAAAVSKAAGLNARAVTDILEGRARSPKLSTVFAISRALNVDPGEMMGLGPRRNIRSDLAEFLSQFSQDEQLRFLNALAALNLSNA